MATKGQNPAIWHRLLHSQHEQTLEEIGLNAGEERFSTLATPKKDAKSWAVKSERGLSTAEDAPCCPEWEGETAYSRLRHFVWNLFEDPEGSTTSRNINLYVIGLILFGAITTLFETLPGIHKQSDFFKHLETFFIVNYTAEFSLRLWSTPDCGAFWRNGMNWVDILSILPFYLEILLQDTGVNLNVLRVLRVGRAFRMVKLGRYSSGIRLIQNALVASLDALQLFAFIFSVLLVVCASAMYYTERGEWSVDEEYYERESIFTQTKEISPFQSIPDSFWFTLVTLTTVGYGDQSPVTAMGIIAGVITQLLGVIMIALPLSIIGANFHEEREKIMSERGEDVEDEGRGALESADNVVATGETAWTDLHSVAVGITEVILSADDFIQGFKLVPGTRIGGNDRLNFEMSPLVDSQNHNDETKEAPGCVPEEHGSENKVVEAPESIYVGNATESPTIESLVQDGQNYCRVPNDTLIQIEGRVAELITAIQKMETTIGI